MHEDNIMINLDTNEIKLIDFGFSEKKTEKSIKTLNIEDKTFYKHLKLLFYCLLDDEINNKHQQSF